MDLNGDGHTDILSGSYSRYEGSMAGLFFVLYGQAGGGFAKPTALNGTDGEPLIMDLPAAEGEAAFGLRTCTRAWAVDLNGDGKLDLVSGNSMGTFGMFIGEGEGKFAPGSTALQSKDGKVLRVDQHSDPCFADWDGDGDQDLISGCDMGTITLFPNVSKEGDAIVFGDPVVLLSDGSEEASAGSRAGDGPFIGTDHFKGPSRATRVTVVDVNGDGKLDLLVGDDVSYVTLKEGVSKEEGIAALLAYQKVINEIFSSEPRVADFENPTEEEVAAMDAHNAKMVAADEAKWKFVEDHKAGFVWLLTQK